MRHVFPDRTIVDAAIFLGDRIVPVDSKFPLENFRRAREAPEEADRKKARREFAGDVKRHVDAIRGKYIRPFDGTFDFALMYVPAEAVYCEIASDEEGTSLADYATERRVIPVSPRLLYTYLATVAMGLRGMELQKGAQDILERLSELEKEWGASKRHSRRSAATSATPRASTRRRRALSNGSAGGCRESPSEESRRRPRRSRSPRCRLRPEAKRDLTPARPGLAHPLGWGVRPHVAADRLPRSFAGTLMPLRVNSEIGKLSSVLVHLPGPEIDRMVPSMMEELLFDDILFGSRAREEHRRFQQVLGYVADEVLDAQDLLADVLEVPHQRAEVLEDLGTVLGWGPDMDYRLRDLPADQLAGTLVAGIERPAAEIAAPASELYWLPPIPNYFFQRDPLVVLGDRAIRGSMATSARLREPLLSGYVFRYHPRFAGPEEDRFWFQEFSADYGRPSAYARMRPTLEGGDILVLREDLLLMGYSERTKKRRSSGWRSRFRKRARRFAGSWSSRCPRPLLHASRHGVHDDLAGRVPDLRADDPRGRRGRGRRLPVRPHPPADLVGLGDGPSLGAAF